MAASSTSPTTDRGWRGSAFGAVAVRERGVLSGKRTVEADPAELHPLQRDLAPFRAEVEAFLKRSSEAGAVSRDTPLSPEGEERLRALGYVN